MNYDKHKSSQVTRSCTNLNPSVWKDQQSIHRNQEFSPKGMLLRPWRSGLVALVRPRRVAVSGCCSASWTWILTLSFPRWFGRGLSLSKRVIPGTSWNNSHDSSHGSSLTSAYGSDFYRAWTLNLASLLWDSLYSDRKQLFSLFEEGLKCTWITHSSIPVAFNSPSAEPTVTWSALVSCT